MARRGDPEQAVWGPLLGAAIRGATQRDAFRSLREAGYAFRDARVRPLWRAAVDIAAAGQRLQEWMATRTTGRPRGDMIGQSPFRLPDRYSVILEVEALDLRVGERVTATLSAFRGRIPDISEADDLVDEAVVGKERYLIPIGPGTILAVLRSA